MRKLRGLLMAAVWTAVAASASAQRITTPYEFIDEGQGLGPFAAWVETNKGLLGLGPEPAPAFGLIYNIRLSGPLQADLSASVLSTSRTVYDTIPADTTLLIENPAAGLVSLGEADQMLMLLMGGLRFDITGPRTFHNLQPYALFGGGVRLRLSSDDDVDADLDPGLRFRAGTSFAGQLGAGIEWFLSRKLTARIEARDVFWKLGIPEGMQRSRVVPDDEWVQNLHASFGLSLRF